MILRLLLFSFFSALIVYIPFYYFAPIYRPLYVHVPLQEINWWIRWNYNIPHGGLQIYVAYVLMFMAIGLSAFLEFVYLGIKSPRIQWTMLAISLAAAFIYLGKIGFYPPGTQMGVSDKSFLLVLISAMVAFWGARFYDQKIVTCLLVLLIAFICLVPPSWSFLSVDYSYLIIPALRTLAGFALNQSYFQYDHLLGFLAMAWIKCGLQIDKFHLLIEFIYWIFFIGAFFFAKALFLDKRLTVYFILSLVMIKIYGNLSPPLACPQVSPLRLDLWLVLLGLVYWKGPAHWTVGLLLGFFLVFHHAFGAIYCLSYLLLILFNFLSSRRKPGSYSELTEDSGFRRNDMLNIYGILANVGLMVMGELINHVFISPQQTVTAMNYLKYNTGFMPIDPRSLFWYVPVIVSMTVLMLWKYHSKLSARYVQTTLFLAFLAIGNLLYFFGRSHPNNLVNISASPWLILFILIDLVMFSFEMNKRQGLKNILVPLLGVLIVMLVTYAYSFQLLRILKMQVGNIGQINEVFNKSKAVDLDYDKLKAISRGNPKIIFLSTGDDFRYYYYGAYTPPPFAPLDSQHFVKQLNDILNTKIKEGWDIIVPNNEFNSLVQTVILLKVKYAYRSNDFVYISNNKPNL